MLIRSLLYWRICLFRRNNFRIEGSVVVQNRIRMVSWGCSHTWWWGAAIWKLIEHETTASGHDSTCSELSFCGYPITLSTWIELGYVRLLPSSGECLSCRTCPRHDWNPFSLTNLNWMSISSSINHSLRRYFPLSMCSWPIVVSWVISEIINRSKQFKQFKTLWDLFKIHRILFYLRLRNFSDRQNKVMKNKIYSLHWYIHCASANCITGKSSTKKI